METMLNMLAAAYRRETGLPAAQAVLVCRAEANQLYCWFERKGCEPPPDKQGVSLSGVPEMQTVRE